MKYKILIQYQTGNSFGSNDTEDYLDLEWDDLDIAKENLQYIKEHQEVYKSVQYLKQSDLDKYLKLFENKPWFVYEPKYWHIESGNVVDEKYYNKHKEFCEIKPDIYYATHCIKLKADNGNYMQISCFWNGYFERLNYIEIVSGDLDTKIYF